MLTLLMFHWIDLLGLSELITYYRNSLLPIKNTLPHWLLFSAPNGLWMFSFTIALALVWKREPAPSLFAWIALMILLFSGIEFGQKLSIIYGTFDFQDLFAYLIGGLVGIGISFKRKAKYD